MFFDPQRVTHVREMIVAETEEARRTALDKLLPYQRQDFIELFKIMAGLPLTIRLLDSPLHEFLPHTDADMAEVAAAAGVDVARVKARAAMLHEANPMLGYRGCRLGVTYPEIYEMQCRAIFEAAVEAMMKGPPLILEVALPFVITATEFARLRMIVERVADEVMRESRAKFEYLVGAAIEIPRAALTADEIAKSAQFFSLHTRNLTEMTYGLSHAHDILLPYLELGPVSC
jgi:pyruvate,orthophosphate dikinase